MPGTLTVGCKLPAGLLLQLWTMEDHDEPVLGGGTKTVKRAVAKGHRVKINGAAKPVGKDVLHDIRFGVGLTFGVDADFFNEWLRANKEMEIVKNGLVFAQAKMDDAAAQAKDHKTLKTGLEPLDPKDLPAEFKDKVETAPAA